MKKIRKAAAGFCLVSIILLQCGCKNAVENRPLLWYTEYTFPFEMTLSSPNGIEYIAHGERTPSAVRITVTAPEPLAGLTVSYADGNCTLIAGETAIPLTGNAASGLTSLFDALLVPTTDGAKLGSSESGETTVTYDLFTLTLDENGLPMKVTTPAREATLHVENFNPGKSTKEGDL